MTIYHGDCREVLPSLPKVGLGLIILDPPYEEWDNLIAQNTMANIMEKVGTVGNVLCFCQQPFDYNLRTAVNPYFRREMIWGYRKIPRWVSKKLPLVSYYKIYWLSNSSNSFFNCRTGVSYSEHTQEGDKGY